MKLFSAGLVLFTSLLTMSYAQMVSIAAPARGQNLTAGQNFTVQLNSADGLTNFQDISVAIGLEACSTASCHDITYFLLGSLLYAGNFTPRRHEDTKPAYQNFTLEVPSNFKAGPARLNVAHFYLIGAGLTPILETKNTTVTISSK